MIDTYYNDFNETHGILVASRVLEQAGNCCISVEVARRGHGGSQNRLESEGSKSFHAIINCNVSPSTETSLNKAHRCKLHTYSSVYHFPLQIKTLTWMFSFELSTASGKSKCTLTGWLPVLLTVTGGGQYTTWGDTLSATQISVDLIH